MTVMEKLIKEMLEDVTALVKITINRTEDGYHAFGRTENTKIRDLCKAVGADADETIAKVNRIFQESDIGEILDQVVNALPGSEERVKFDVLEIKKQMEELKDED
jgi:hypothetical protein